MDTEGLATQFLDVARHRAAERNVRIGQNVEIGLQRAAQTAANKIINLEQDEQDKTVQQVTLNFQLVIDEMIEQAASAPSYGVANSGELGEPAYRAALGKLCPIWPFC